MYEAPPQEPDQHSFLKMEHWRGFTSDEAIGQSMRRVMYRALAKSKAYTKGELRKDILDALRDEKFRFEISIEVSDPDEKGRRTVSGIAHSPFSGEMIYF